MDSVEKTAYPPGISELFDLTHTIAESYLSGFDYPWQAIEDISKFILSAGPALDSAEYNEIAKNVWVHKTAKVAPTAFVGAPAIIGAGTEIRHCAFIRGSVVTGENCVVGNSVELKNAILFDNVEAPHLSYIGDSILGFGAHMGAGSVTSNFRADKAPVTVKCGEKRIETGLEKLGAMLGDFVEVGANSVLNPGTIVGRNTTVYPLSSVRGTIPPDSIFKTGGEIVKKVKL